MSTHAHTHGGGECPGFPMDSFRPLALAHSTQIALTIMELFESSLNVDTLGIP